MMYMHPQTHGQQYSLCCLPWRHLWGVIKKLNKSLIYFWCTEYKLECIKFFARFFSLFTTPWLYRCFMIVILNVFWLLTCICIKLMNVYVCVCLLVLCVWNLCIIFFSDKIIDVCIISFVFLQFKYLQHVFYSI
jgi:hypothetical protein